MSALGADPSGYLGDLLGRLTDLDALLVEGARIGVDEGTLQVIRDEIEATKKDLVAASRSSDEVRANNVIPFPQGRLGSSPCR